MKKITCLIGLLFICFFSSGQSRTFIQKTKIALESKDEADSIIEIGHSEEQYDFMSEGMEGLETLFLSEFKHVSRNKPDDLKMSNILMTLAKIATEAWRGSHYVDHKKWRKLNKYFQRASNLSTGRFNILKAVSFRIPLVNNEGKKFYYDRKGVEGELNLFKGDSPKTKEEREEIEQVPLIYFTESELVEGCMRQMRRRGLYGDLKRGYYAYAGVKVELDEKSIYKNRIPTARVVVVLGARRMRRVRVKEF